MHRMGSPSLIRIVLGHGQDVWFCSGVDAAMAVYRKVIRVKTALQDWSVSQGPAHRIRRFLKQLGWSVAAPWEWRHEDLRKIFNFDPNRRGWIENVEWAKHLLRESWRFFWWKDYIKSKRHEVDDLQDCPYDSMLAKAARDLAKDRGALAVGVLVGAFVSPELFSRILGMVGETCPWCGQEGFFQHVVWECERYPFERLAYL